MAVNEYDGRGGLSRDEQYRRGVDRLDGAFFLFCQKDIDHAPTGDYYLARMMFFEPGRYTIKAYGDDIVRFGVDGKQVFEASEKDGVALHSIEGDPAEGRFDIKERGSYRLDAFYTQVPDDTPSWIIFSIYNESGTLVYSSRKKFWTCGGLPIDGEQLDPEGGKDPIQDDRLLQPVWLPNPNWENGLVERLGWETWVGQSEAGAEQRVGLRRFPRREFEVDFLANDYKRALTEMGLAGVGQARWLVPLWMNRVSIGEDVPAGTTTVFANLTYRQFAEGDVVMLRGDEFFDYELAVINEIKSGELVLRQPLHKAWPARVTYLYPVRECRITEAPDLNWASSRVLQTSVVFAQQTPERQQIDISDLPRHPKDNLPILAIGHNWKQNPKGQYNRVVQEFDNVLGRPAYFDVGGQSTQNLQLSWVTQGLDGLELMRSVFYYMRGKQNICWLPTLTDDIQIIEKVDPKEGEIIIRRMGFAQYAGDAQRIRRNICMELHDGTLIFNQVVSARGKGTETEVLSLADTLPKAFEPWDFHRVFFIAHARFDTDSIEIQHYTDIMGVRDVTIPFTQIENLRQV